MIRYCRKCNARTGMVVEETATGKILEEIDLCKDCLFAGCRFEPITEQITINDEPDWNTYKVKINEFMEKMKKETTNE